METTTRMLTVLLLSAALGGCAEGGGGPRQSMLEDGGTSEGLSFSDASPGAICGNGTLDPGEECESPFGACCNTSTCRFRAPAIECRSATDPCDETETCTGTSDACPEDAIKADGESCPGGGSCTAGVCEGDSDMKHPSTGNVLFYPFDDGTATDTSGNGHHGTAIGAEPVSGRYGTGFDFDGQDDQIEIADTSKLFVANTLTVELWLYPAGGALDAVLYSDAQIGSVPATELTIGLRLDGRLELISNTGCSDFVDNQVSASAVLSWPDRWTHLAVTWDGLQIRFYQDGALVETQPFAHTPCEKVSAPFRVGLGLDGGQAYAGHLDELKVSDHAKSEVEIVASMGYDSSTAVCGNGVQDSGEACDDGNTLSCDGCTMDCGAIETKQTYFRDKDNDGEGDPEDTVLAYCTGAGRSTSNDDCDDTNAAVYPGASEICGDGLDNDCAGGDAPCPGCGNGILEGGEECEAPFDACCNSSTCTFRSSGSVCRPATGPCDAEDYCSGLTTGCPSDESRPDGASCPGGTCQDGACDTSEGASCGNGVLEQGEECESPFDACCDAASCVFSSVDRLCRPAVDVCDVSESCDGASAACPDDEFKSAGTVCRAKAGECDKVESCDGVSAACPADALRGANAICRPAIGECDVSESCDGTSAACPADDRAGDGTGCPGGACMNGSCQTVLSQDGCYWRYTDTCGHLCGIGTSVEAFCDPGHYVAGFGLNTFNELAKYNTRIYCCPASLQVSSCTWKYIDTCGHLCGIGTSMEASCDDGHYMAGFGVNTFNEYARYNYRVYCCQDNLDQGGCSWQYMETCGHACGVGTPFDVTGPTGSYVAGFGINTFNEYAKYNTRIYTCQN